MIVVSPWTVGGFVNSEVFDHTSVLRFLETRFGIAEPNISPWRRAVTGDLTSVFDFSRSQTSPALPADDGIARADRQRKQPAPKRHDESLPRQEPGQRPARPLPYDFDVSGRPVVNGFALNFVNRGRAGVAFRASARDVGPWFFTVEAGKTLSYTLPRSGPYDFHVSGPNGFYRRFAGADRDPVIVTFSSSEFSAANNSTSAVTVRDNYGKRPPETVAPGQEIVMRLDLSSTANWYDFAVHGTGGFVRQFAGHIENGAPSLSDPLLG